MFVAPNATSKTVDCPVDCVVLGGGITGAGVARDAAIRGHDIVLLDSNDFASGTSHLTSKLIHGGLRYLEQGQFRLVYEGIRERDRLLNLIAPTLVKPIRFIIPFERNRFPKWLLTVLGLQLYGLSERLRWGRRSSPLLQYRLRESYPVMRFHSYGVTFWDAQTNDARLVLATLRSAQAAGAKLYNHTSIKKAQFEKGVWTLELFSSAENHTWTLQTKTIVNATGPWSPMTANLIGAVPMDLMWIKGSHIILRKPEKFGTDAVIIRSVKDQRSLWVVPWQHRLIVGSTESEFTGDLRDVRPDRYEVDDLFESFLRIFPTSGLTRKDITCVYAGVRPIIKQSIDSENSLSREHRIVIDHHRHMITITGGKLTTFRKMAEQTMDEADQLLGAKPISADTRHHLRNNLLWPELSKKQAQLLRKKWTAKLDQAAQNGSSKNGSVHNSHLVDHLVRHYGHDAEEILNETIAHPEQGQPLFPPMPHCLAEMTYLCRNEHVSHLIDLVKRRIPLYFLGDHCGMDVLPSVVDHIAPILGWDEERKAKELAAVKAEWDADLACLNAPVRPMRTQTRTQIKI